MFYKAKKCNLVLGLGGCSFCMVMNIAIVLWWDCKLAMVGLLYGHGGAVQLVNPLPCSKNISTVQGRYYTQSAIFFTGKMQ